MELRADATIPFPRPMVFAAYRDNLMELLPYLPNVRGIEIKSREEKDGKVSFVNVWSGGGDIPAAARAFVSEKMLSWDDIATWNENDFTCSWVIKTHAFSDAVDCHGGNKFIEKDANTTILEIRGVLTIDGKKIPGVPGFLANKVAKTVEDMLVNKIQPNLVSTASGLAKFLADKNKK
jgi:hypothetical protein